MIPYGRQDISKEDIDAVVNVLHSEWLTQGPTVPLFEKSLQEYCGGSYAVAVNSATSALHCACLALGVSSDDIVWTSAITFVASANAAVYCGATVDFIDIDPRTYNLSIESLREKLFHSNQDGTLPKVLIAVHMCGQSCDMKSIYDLGKEYGFRIIEDASHALGGTYKKMPIGNCQFSDITVFSFHPVKIITSGEGGVAVTNDQDLAEKLRLLRSHGVVRDSRMQPEDSADEIWNYRQEILGFNYRMTDIQAVLGLSQMVRVNAFVSSRREVAMKYGADLQHLPIELPWQHPETVSSYHLYPIRINLSRAGISQKLFYEEMQRNGVGVNLHYAPVYRHPFYRAMGFKRGYCPEAELYFQEAISLPIFPALKELEYLKIISSIKALL